MLHIPCILMRGGTSRGPFFLATDLPSDCIRRDHYLIQIMGSGHPLEIDGLGGGFPQTSKAAIISRSASRQTDVDYLFVQVMVEQQRVDTAPNCGNMLAAAGAFAIERQLVQTTSPVTCVRIRNINTNTLVNAELQTPNGKLTYQGDTHIDGVPGTAAPVYLTFLNAAGCKTGQLFPTQARCEHIDGINVTCIDMAMPVVIIPAHEMGKTAQEAPELLENDNDFMQRLEHIRLIAGKRMGFGDVKYSVIPKPVLIGLPRHQGTVSVRYFTSSRCHRALSITGAIATASACVCQQTCVHSLIKSLFMTSSLNSEPASITRTECIRLEHPSGSLDVKLTFSEKNHELQASVIRTARKILSGEVWISTE